MKKEMKQKIIILFAMNISLHLGLSAQSIEKMNKSELIDHIYGLTGIIDSITRANQVLTNSASELSHNSRLLNERNKEIEQENSRLNAIVSKKQKEIEDLSEQHKNEVIELRQEHAKNTSRLKSENEETVARLNEEIRSLGDSLLVALSYDNYSNSAPATASATASSAGSTNPGNNDFLNKYYFDQFPLLNNSFSLVLANIICGNIEDAGSDYGPVRSEVAGVPEMLSPLAFTYWGVKPSMVNGGGKKFDDFLFSGNVDYFSSMLPTIEVLKNKLFTLKYSDGTEESYLFNVEKISSNNYREILRLELANEEVNGDGMDDSSKDMVWSFFVIGNECYLALTAEQLSRIGLMLLPPMSLEMTRGGEPRVVVVEYHFGGSTTGNGLYLSRNKDSYMEASGYLDPRSLVFLFKFK
jgi:hypothetical protein